MYSQTVLCRNLYQNPSLEVDNNNNGNSNSNAFDSRENQSQFEDFFEDFYCEASKFGKLETMIVCENTNDHLKGNVYARFKYEEDAQKAMDNFNGRWYNGRPVYCELSPVTDLKEACCRQHDTRDCSRGGYCNFMHAKRPSSRLLRDLETSQKAYWQKMGQYQSSDSESPSPDRERRRRR